jgi:hypothetical protein
MKFAVPMLAAAALSASASAAFVGFVTETTVVAPGKTATKLYAQFTNASDTLLNAFQIHATATYGGATGLGTGNFWHQDFLNGNVSTTFAGTWNPSLLLGSNANLDSWVTIGGEAASFANSTTADPGWGGAAFNQPGIPDTAEAGLAGWYNGNPPNLQGRGVTFGANDFRVLVGNFVMTEGNGVMISLRVGFNQGIGTSAEFGEGLVGLGILSNPDSDGDGHPDLVDNCPDRPNPTQHDCNLDGVGDACDCPEDIAGSCGVTAEDLAAVLFAWGPCPSSCAEDLDSSGTVDGEDLVLVLSRWGPCHD